MKSLIKKFAVLLSICLLVGSGMASAIDTKATPYRRYNPSKVNNRSLRIKFKAESGVSIQNNEFAAKDPAVAARLNAIMKKAKKNKAQSLGQNATDNVVSRSLKQYSAVKFDQDINADSVISELEALGVIEDAYPEPLPAPAPTADYKGLQQYLKAAPTGIDANYAATVAGGTGNKVKIIDIEYSWNTAHEDLTKTVAARVPHGTMPSDPFNNTNHGTSVLGEMVATSNAFGVTGITSDAGIELINSYSDDLGWDIAGALALAATRTSVGDVIIIEQQVWGPTATGNDFLPVEWTPEIYDAIKALTDSGRTIVEPAANGYHNLDDPMYTNGTTFPLGKADSGAIIVGAGENCSGQLRSRLSFSNYGNRVNLQGPGDCVTSTGYGDLAGTTANNQYTERFNGTSSASPVVAAAAAALSSAYETAKAGQGMTPALIRSTLMSTGTPQNTIVVGNIGKYPNLKAALATINSTPVDTQAPTVPGGVTIKLNASKKPVITWKASTDNVQVASYSIIRNGVFYANVPSNVLTFTDATVTKGKKYTYTVKAIDTSNNKSALSKAVSITVK